MAHREIVVVGASAGGIPALTALVAGLPADFPAALVVAVHIQPYAVSRLPEILTRAGPLPAAHAIHGAEIVPGRIYVAPPDRHLLVRRGWLELTRGPRENHARPAIDPLFRTAARAYGPRAIGIVLSGALYDGSLGLLAIETRGGVAIVQEPQEAPFDSMPRNALRFVTADHVLRAAAMPAVLDTLVREPLAAEGVLAMTDDEERIDDAVSATFAEQVDGERADETTVYTCPDCGGVLWQAGDGAELGFRCHVGHAYAPEVLLSEKSEELEAALWSSLRLLKEKVTLARQMAHRAAIDGNGSAARETARRFAEQAELNERYAESIQELLTAMPNPMDR
jgi:two-component system chemotaxis response regulator CheB